MTKITFAVNVPVKGFKKDWNNSTYKDIKFIEIIRHVSLSFELCNECGSQIVGIRKRKGLKTCSTACNKKQMDKKYKKIAEMEVNTNGKRPRIFWHSIAELCFERDLYTCQRGSVNSAGH